MGLSTDGQICFGVLLPDPDDMDGEYPWGDDLEEWWRGETGYHPPFELFTPEGDYIDGKEPSKDRIRAYFDARREWDAAHPLPVELVNACSCDYPLWIAAVPGTVRTAGRGRPVTFEPSGLVADPEKTAALVAFLAKYLPGEHEDPAWHLSSNMG